MGKQFNFFMDEKDEERLRKYLLESHVKLIFEGRNLMPVEITVFPPPFSGKGWFIIYLYKEEWGELVARDVSTTMKRIDQLSSPVIEFSRTVIRSDARGITPGRIWFQSNHFKEDILLNKCSEINAFYLELMRQIKMILPKQKKPFTERNTTIYCSDSIKIMLDDGYKIM